MKKLLLTLAAFAMAATSVAEVTTLNVKDATELQGTDNAEKPKEGDFNGEARNIKPLNSLKISGYSFTFTKNTGSDPAYYFAPSWNPNNAVTIRLYKGKDGGEGNSMTITAPAGVEFASITGYNGNTKIEVYNGEKTNTCTYKATSSVRFDKFEVSTEAGSVTPPVAGDITVKKATEVAAGEVAFVFNEGYVETFAADEAFGYWMAVAATPADEMKVSKEAIFTLASTDKGYTIKDCNDRFMGWDGQHWSFNAYTSADEGNCYWTATMVDGKVKIANTEKYVEEGKDPVEVYLAGKAYNSDYEMCPTSFENKPLPMLYVKGEGSGVANIAVENNGEAVYYNLQGVRVENPVKGLYIVVKGGKSQKVMF